MPTDEDQGFEAHERARQRRAAREPRRRAVREAFAAVKRQESQSPDAIRAALIDELATRGVTDPTPEELDFLTEAVTSPRRTATRLIFRQLKALGAVVNLFRDVATYSQPRWAWEPDDVPAVPDGEPEAATVTFDLTPAQLVEGRSTVTRAIADIRDQSDQGDDEEVRPVGAWLSLDADTSIGVHIGTFRIGELIGPDTRRVRAAIARWGGETSAIRVDADLLGSTPDSAHLELRAPTSREQ